MTNKDWNDFMGREGLVLSKDDAYTPTDTAINNADVQSTLCDLSHFGLIRVHGRDTRQFLQNQFSNDVNAVSAGLSQLSAYCTPKGRVLALFRLCQIGDAFYLHLPHSRIAATLQRLRMFVMMSDVKLEDLSSQWVALGVAGDEVEKCLLSIAGSLPKAADAALPHEQSIIIRVPGNQRYLIIASNDQAIQYWTALKNQCRITDSTWWALQEVRAGLPQVFEANVEAFVPQMLNLDRVNGLSFRKGCYPGQEIVARTRYLGKLKRRMYRGTIDSQTPPLPGTEVVSKADGAKVGSIVLSAPDPALGSELLTVLQIAAAETQDLQIDGHAIILKDLPYSVEETEE